MIAAVLIAALLAWQEAIPPEVLRHVERGQVTELETLFAGAPTLTQRKLLARAQANRAAELPEPLREAAFQDAGRRYRAWAAAISSARGGSPEQQAVALAEAELEHADMILTRWSAPDLDRFSLQPPGSTGFDELRKRLEQATTFSAAAEERLRPLLEQLAGSDADLEEKFLALGIFDRVQVLRRDAQLQRAWLRLSLAQLGEDDPKRRADNLRNAERLFRTLVDLLGKGPARTRCRIGLARTYRIQGRTAEAVALLRSALPEAAGFRAAAQIRYEWGRTLIDAGRFDDARAVLAPLARLDPADMTDDQQPGLFYVNLAQLWDAYSYLLESRLLRRQAATSSARDSLLSQADRRRATALSRFNQLAGRGRVWEDLVDAYLAGELDVAAAPTTLGIAELLFIARREGRAGDWPRAAELLDEALRRQEVPVDLLPDLRFEHATALALTGATRPAAARFLAFVEQHVSHPLATRAITRAYELQAELADASRSADDYRAVAATLATLLARFPEHPDRLAATWWAPRALEAAGDYAAAARGYAAVPPQSEHWQQARQRANACLLADWQARGAPADDAARLARALLRFADDAAVTGQDPDLQAAVRKAILDAAELYQVAGDHPAVLRTLDHPGLIGGGPDDTARQSGLRIAGLAQLGRFEDAARLAQTLLRLNDPAATTRTLPLLQAALGELTRREAAGDEQSLAALANAVLPVFTLAEERLRAAGQTAALRPVLFGLARLQFHAGRFSQAEETITTLLLAGEADIATRWWQARILTALARSAPAAERPARRTAALAAWGRLLPTLRTAAPERYWPARYEALRLLAEDGRLAEVRQAIEQERVWFPDLGGPPWKEKIEALAGRATEAGPD